MKAAGKKVIENNIQLSHIQIRLVGFCGEREGERERERGREGGRDRERQRQTETDRDRQTEREKQTERETDRDRERELNIVLVVTVCPNEHMIVLLTISFLYIIFLSFFLNIEFEGVNSVSSSESELCIQRDSLLCLHISYVYTHNSLITLRVGWNNTG